MRKFWKFRRGGGGKFWGLILENPEGRGVIQQIPSVGGGGWGMDIFWNNTLTFLRNSQDKKERTKRNKHVRMQKGATFTIVSTSLLIGLNFKR